MSPNRAMQTAAVYACVRILAESLAQLPAKVFEEDASGNMHEVKEHPMSAILSEAPNSYQDDFQFREMGQAHCALWGNFYNEIQKNRYGDIVGLYPLKPWGDHAEAGQAGEAIHDQRRHPCTTTKCCTSMRSAGTASAA